MTDWDGGLYARFADLQHALGRTFVDELPIEGSEQVLDVGCGDGEVTARLAVRVPRGSVVGIDPSPLMIARAKKYGADSQNTTAAAHGALRFEPGTVLALSFAAEFDLVVSLNALHWVTDLGRAFGQLRAVTRDSGRIVVQFVGAGERRSIEATAMDAAQSSRWSDHFSGFAAPFIHVSEQESRRLAEAAALRMVETRQEQHSFDFADRQSFERWCTLGFGSWLERLPDDRAAEFVHDVVERYSAESGSETRFTFEQLHLSMVPEG